MIHINELVKSYPGFTLHCSLNVEKGSITGLIGENGAGKSTLFKSILQLIKPDNGTILLDGKDVRKSDKNDKAQIGTVLAESGFSDYLTVHDVIIILRSFYPDFDEESFVSRCRRFKLDENKRIGEFSTGMKAKLKVLVALSHNAKILLLDEPTSGLDVMAREDVLMMLREYMEENEDRTILISSHISSDLESLCDDFYMIHDGNIILHEETDVLLGSYALLKVSVEEYEDLDKSYIIRRKKESYGYCCLTDHRDYYREKYPELVMERSGIDDLIMNMVKGDKI